MSTHPTIPAYLRADLVDKLEARYGEQFVVFQSEPPKADEWSHVIRKQPDAGDRPKRLVAVA